MTHLRLYVLATLACSAASGCAAPLQNAPATRQAQADAGLTHDQLLEVGRELERRGDSLRAEQYYSEAIERGAPEAEVLPLLLRVYVNDRQYRMASARAQDYLRKHPSCVPVRLLLAALWEAVGNFPRAADDYRHVLEQKPAHAEAHFGLANVLLALGQDRMTADLHLRRYLELAPHGPYAERAQAALLKEVLP